MKSRKKLEPNREENYSVNATLTVEGIEISDVPCKIYLPERNHEKPYVIFNPLQENAEEILSSHEGELRANIYGFNKEIQTTIKAPKVYLSEKITKYFSGGIPGTTVLGEPQDLQIIHHRNHKDQEKTDIVFWVSPNKYLTPSMNCTKSYTGEVKYMRGEAFEFIIKNDAKIIFDKHFSYKTANNGDLIQWSSLVACTALNIPADDVEALKTNILSDIDDFLLIASFAIRERTACLGWTATDKNSYSKFYRGNYTFPEVNVDSMDDGIIDVQHFKRFIETCYPAFLRFENKLAIRNALSSATPFTLRILETSFLRTFSGLETLILDFRRRENREFSLPNDDWRNLKKNLEKFIKESSNPKLECHQRKTIYNKLGELNRVSLKEAFSEFCEKYVIGLNDLWPVFSNQETVGLVDIRNRLIHGDPFPQDLFMALVVANQHMKYTLERVIVRVLGWGIGETKVSPAYLREHVFDMKVLISEQKRLSEYIRN
ncbi:MAG: hypothetical protein ACXWCZ_12425 [Flavisolibacter sp.]